MVMLHWNNSSDPLANQPAARPANRVGHENGGGGPFGGQKSDFFQKKWGPRGAARRPTRRAKWPPAKPPRPGPDFRARLPGPRAGRGVGGAIWHGPGKNSPALGLLSRPRLARKKKAALFLSASGSTLLIVFFFSPLTEKIREGLIGRILCAGPFSDSLFPWFFSPQLLFS